MKQITAIILSAIFLISATNAQDGIYGSFMVGFKNIDMAPLDDALNSTKMYNDNIEFGNSYLTIGGEGHIILAKHLVIGGKAIGTFRNLEVDFKADTTGPTDSLVKNDVKITTGMAVGTLGFAFLAGDEKQLRIIPHVGIGISSFLLQRKDRLEDNEGFNDLHIDDQMSTIQKAQIAIDLAASFDWFIELIEFKRIIPGLGFGPLIHIEAGYTLTPGDTQWLRDIDVGKDYNPNLSFKGFYAVAGIGIGLSAGD